MGIYEAQCIRNDFITISSVLLCNCCSNFCFTCNHSRQTISNYVNVDLTSHIIRALASSVQGWIHVNPVFELQAIMSWNSYVDSLIAQSQGNIDKATIIGLNGAIWTPAGSVSIFVCCCCCCPFKSNSPLNILYWKPSISCCLVIWSQISGGIAEKSEMCAEGSALCR